MLANLTHPFPLCVYRLLNEATGSLLDDVQLVNTLQTSKVTATEVAEQLEISELTESQIDTAREVRERGMRGRSRRERDGVRDGAERVARLD